MLFSGVPIRYSHSLLTHVTKLVLLSYLDNGKVKAETLTKQKLVEPKKIQIFNSSIQVPLGVQNGYFIVPVQRF